jgi:dihydroorotate dehydrogenase (fumarate)/dihydroorotate dehydrogenase
VNLYRTLVRPAAFLLPAETAHHAGLWALGRERVWEAFGPALSVADPALRQHLGGLEFRNPVGVAPGFDKDCEVLRGLACLGFGFIEGGTVLPLPRAGNPGPRLLRYPAQEALANCLGLPSRGVAGCVEFLRRFRAGGTGSVPVIVSFMGFTLEQYVDVFRALEPWADALEVALRCPNTPDERNFVDRAEYAALLDALMVERHKPVWVKLPSLDVEVDRAHLVDLVESGVGRGVDGFMVSGTRPIEEPRLSRGRGTLSGRPVRARTLDAVRAAYGAARGRAPIVAQGGIGSGADAYAAIACGASAVSVYTQFVYEGPGLARRINLELLALMKDRGVGSIAELCGSEHASSREVARGTATG